MIDDDNHRDNPEKRTRHSTSTAPSSAAAPECQRTGNVRSLYPADFRVREAVAYIHRNYARIASVLELTRCTNLSRSRLDILFKRELGVSPVTYLTETRIREAARLFEKSPVLRVKEVMAAVGIYDRTYFGRQFKRMFGVTPTQYRATCALNNSMNERFKLDSEVSLEIGNYSAPYL